MGISITAIDRFYTHNGSAYTGGGVGYHKDNSGIQYPDNWGTNDRITIRTDSVGASRISIGGLKLQQQNVNALRLDVTTNSSSYLKGGSGGVALATDGSGSIDRRLAPNTTYYVWLFCNGWRHRYNDTNLTVTASGVYGTAATPSAPDGQFGSRITVTLTGGFSGASYVVKTSLAGKTETLLNRGSATSLSWTPAAETYAPLLPNASGATATITCETWYGESLIGSNSGTLQVSFAAGSLPPESDAGWATAAVLNEGSAAGFTVPIQGYSKFTVRFDAAKLRPQYGASLSTWSIRCGGKTQELAVTSGNSLTTELIADTSASIVCTATDSRGQSCSVTLSQSLEPYARPALSEIRMFRCDSAGKATDEGSCVSVKATMTLSSLGGANSGALSAASRKLSGSYGGATSMSSGEALLLSGFDPDSSYEIRVTATDSLGNSTTVTQKLPTRQWAMKFRPDGSGVAFGKASEREKTLELGPGWALVLRDAEGNEAVIDYAWIRSMESRGS